MSVNKKAAEPIELDVAKAELTPESHIVDLRFGELMTGILGIVTAFVLLLPVLQPLRNANDTIPWLMFLSVPIFTTCMFVPSFFNAGMLSVNSEGMRLEGRFGKSVIEWDGIYEIREHGATLLFYGTNNRVFVVAHSHNWPGKEGRAAYGVMVDAVGRRDISVKKRMFPIPPNFRSRNVGETGSQR